MQIRYVKLACWGWMLGSLGIFAGIANAQSQCVNGNCGGGATVTHSVPVNSFPAAGGTISSGSQFRVIYPTSNGQWTPAGQGDGRGWSAGPVFVGTGQPVQPTCFAGGNAGCGWHTTGFATGYHATGYPAYSGSAVMTPSAYSAPYPVSYAPAPSSCYGNGCMRNW